MTAASTFDVRYVQYAFGTIKEENLDKSLKENFYAYQAARVLNTAREYFFEKTAGLKQLAKIPSLIDMHNQWRGITIANPSVKAFMATCQALRKILTLSESYTKLKGVVSNDPAHSVWEQAKEATTTQRWLARGAAIADWTMSSCESYKWLAKIGFVAARTWIDKVFNVASITFISHHAYTEGAKWWTGRMIDPMTGKETDFTWEKNKEAMVKSALMCTILAAYAGLTAISIAQMAGYQVANVAFLNFALFSTAVTATIGQHFWNVLVVDGGKPKQA